MKKRLKALIACAKILGLAEVDLYQSNDFLENDEYGLCYQTIITQMYEDDIKIDAEIYSFIQDIGELMALPASDFSFMQDLITDENELFRSAKLQGLLK